MISNLKSKLSLRYYHTKLLIVSEFALIVFSSLSSILLFDNGKTVKLCDFGTLRRVDTQVTQEKGSIAYMAPEVIKTQSYTEKCDVYSWGVLLWEMITRERPYSDREACQVIFAVIDGRRLQLPQKVHPIFLKLMTFSWDDEPEKRPDMNTVQEIMQELFAIVVDENDPSRCTSLNIPNFNDKVTDCNDENSTSDSCEVRIEEQNRVDLKERQLQRMVSYENYTRKNSQMRYDS